MGQGRTFGALAVFVGVAILLAAVLVTDQMFGRPTVLIDRWYFAIGGVAAVVAGICLRRGAPAFAALAFVLITGGAAQLYVTDPLWFSTLHLNPTNWKEWATVAVIGAEALVAWTVLLRAGFGTILRETEARLGLSRLALFVLITGILSVPVLGYLARGAEAAYGAHVLVGIVLTLVHLSVFAAMSQVKSPISGLYRLSPLVPAALTLAVSLILSFYSFERMPHVEDEVAYLFQAKIFAGGALSAPAPVPALLPGLDYYLFDVQDGRWYAATAPGWPVALAAGVAAGVPWLVNPLLAALSVLLAHAVANRLAGRDQADLVAMMMGASPWLLAMAASLMTHTLTLFMMLLAWWLLLRAGDRANGALRRLFIAGLAMGWIFATRPLDGLVVGGLTGLWLLAIAPQGGIGRALVYGVGCVATGVLYFVHNMLMTGSALISPLKAYIERSWGPGANDYGFGPQIGPPGGWGWLDLRPGHTAGEGLVNLINLTANLQFEMMGWSIGSLAFVLAFLLWQKPNRNDLLMGGVILAIMAAMFFYWFADSYYIGPRYWFLASFPLFYLSARGYQAIRERFPDQDDQAFVRIDSLIWYACIFGFCVFLPWRAVTKYYEYNGFHPTVREDAADGRFDGKLVLVERNGDPGSALMLNDPWLRGTIYLDDNGQIDEAALRAAFPDREIVRYRAQWN